MYAHSCLFYLVIYLLVTIVFSTVTISGELKIIIICMTIMLIYSRFLAFKYPHTYGSRSAHLP